MRVHDLADPFRPEEVAFYVPEGDAEQGININDVYVDERGLVYAIDRTGGGLFVLELEL